jgi:hypothetical protein
MKERIIILLTAYENSIKQIELCITDGNATIGTEYRLSIEKKCYSMFIEQLQIILNSENK